MLEAAQWRLRHGDDVIALPPKALALLILLVEHAGNMVTKGDILAKVWDGAFVEENNIAFYVAMLRKALADPPDTTYIETVRTRGYRFVAPVAVATDTGLGNAEKAPEAEPVAPGEPAPHTTSSTPEKRRRSRAWASAALVVTLVAIVAIGLKWAGASRGSVRVRSVTVLPFHAIAPAGDQAYLQSGIANAVAMRLGDVATLRVPPLAAIRAGEGPFEAGRRLATDAVLTGTIQLTDRRLHVSAEVFRVADGTRLEAWSFETAPGEMLSVQNQIAEQLTARFTRSLIDQPSAQFVRRDTASPDAYDLFLQAREKWSRRTPAAVKQAIALYERALALDPKFVRAYAGLANCYNLAWSGLPARVRYPLAKQNAEQALALDPDSSEARTAIAFLRYKFERRWRDAEDEFQRAIALDPNNTLARHWHGEFLKLMGRIDDGIDELTRALELDPASLAIRADLAAAYIAGGRLGDARRVLQSGLAIDPNWVPYSINMAEILALEHRDRESAEQWWRGLALAGTSITDIDELRTGFERSGRPGMIRAQVRQLLRHHPEVDSPEVYFAATNLSFAYAELGEPDQAFRWIEVALERGEDAPSLLLTAPAYRSLRSDPRFEALLVRLNLSPPPLGASSAK